MINKATKKDSSGKSSIDKMMGSPMAAGLSSDEIANGLKEALKVGAEKGTAKLSTADGFLKDALCYEIIKPEDVGAEGSKIVLTARSGRSALAHRFRKLGYDFTRNDIDVLYEQFVKVADSKKEVENEDLLAMAKQFKPESAVV